MSAMETAVMVPSPDCDPRPGDDRQPDQLPGPQRAGHRQFKPALEAAIKANVPYVLDVIMANAPVPTAGHRNIMDIYSPGKKVHHVAT